MAGRIAETLIADSCREALTCDYGPSPVFPILTTLKKSEHGQHSAAVGVISPFTPAAPEGQLPSNNSDQSRELWRDSIRVGVQFADLNRHSSPNRRNACLIAAAFSGGQGFSRGAFPGAARPNSSLQRIIQAFSGTKPCWRTTHFWSSWSVMRGRRD